MVGELGSSLFGGLDFAWLARLGSLLVLPFAHEDLAIVAGAYIVVHDLMPVSLVTLSIYGGIIASDFALYGIGAGARRLPWLSRFAVDSRVEHFAETVKRNMFGLVAICRLVPGMVFVAFVACGWMRVPLARFTVASLIISALYLPIVFYLVVVFGEAMDHRVGLWSWPLLLGVLVVAGYARQRVLAFREAKGAELHASARSPKFMGATAAVSAKPQA